jgi:hypothetical protein
MICSIGNKEEVFTQGLDDLPKATFLSSIAMSKCIGRSGTESHVRNVHGWGEISGKIEGIDVRGSCGTVV